MKDDDRPAAARGRPPRGATLHPAVKSFLFDVFHDLPEQLSAAPPAAEGAGPGADPTARVLLLNIIQAVRQRDGDLSAASFVALLGSAADNLPGREALRLASRVCRPWGGARQEQVFGAGGRHAPPARAMPKPRDPEQLRQIFDLHLNRKMSFRKIESILKVTQGAAARQYRRYRAWAPEILKG